MKIKRKALVFAGAFVIATAGIASADITIPTFPAIVPDICTGPAGCLTFTNSTALTGIQNIVGQISQIKQAAQNLLALPGMTPSGIQAYIGTVTSAGRVIRQDIKADTAANAVMANAQTQAAQRAKADQDALGATGALQSASAENEHLGNIDSTGQAQLDLAAQQVQEAAGNRTDAYNAFKPPAVVPPSSQMFM